MNTELKRLPANPVNPAARINNLKSRDVLLNLSRKFFIALVYVNALEKTRVL